MLKKIVIYGLLALCGFLAYQWATLYIQGIERNPYQSMYARSIEPRLVHPDKLKKGEAKTLEQCLPVQVISQTKLPEKLRNKKDNEPSLAQTPVAQEPSYPLLLNRWTILPSLEPLRATVKLHSDGSTTLETEKLNQHLALGRMREIGLWAGYELVPDPDHQNSYTFDISYQQDLFKLGPEWTRLRVEAGYSQSLGWNAKTQLGFALRF